LDEVLNVNSHHYREKGGGGGIAVSKSSPSLLEGGENSPREKKKGGGGLGAQWGYQEERAIFVSRGGGGKNGHPRGERGGSSEDRFGDNRKRKGGKGSLETVLESQP